jgi:hypothetical protein
MGERKGLPSTTFNYNNMRGICEEKGLPRATFDDHKIVETGEGKRAASIYLQLSLILWECGKK